jgi:hypothetical protein
MTVKFICNKYFKKTQINNKVSQVIRIFKIQNKLISLMINLYKMILNQ